MSTGCDGQDWAGYQPARPPTTGLGFVLVKATEGTGYVNPRYATQIATGRGAHLVVGHYHFVRPGSMTAQATYFLQHAVFLPGDVLALDWEDTGVSGAEKDAWIRHVQAAEPAHRVILYCNRDFWLNRDTTSFAGDGLWIADPSAPKGAPRIDSDWLIHQYAETGGYDRDYSHLTAAQLRSWAAGKTPTVEDDLTTVDLTDAAATKVATTLLALLKDDPTDDKNAKKPLGNILWDTGEHAFQANNAAQQILEKLNEATPGAPSDAQMAALGQQLAGNAAFSQTFATAVAEQLVEKLAARLES